MGIRGAGQYFDGLLPRSSRFIVACHFLRYGRGHADAAGFIPVVVQAASFLVPLNVEVVAPIGIAHTVVRSFRRLHDTIISRLIATIDGRKIWARGLATQMRARAHAIRIPCLNVKLRQNRTHSARRLRNICVIPTPAGRCQQPRHTREGYSVSAVHETAFKSRDSLLISQSGPRLAGTE